MAKIGRNKPCPCGSGKKYKNCCRGKHPTEPLSTRVAGPASAELNRDAVNADTADFPMTPYVAAKEFERSELFARMKLCEPARARLFWTPSRVAGLETEQLVTRLGDLGVDASREAYLELAADRTSAWNLSDVWREKIQPGLSPHQDDFIGLAACELWKRYCAERPSVEMLDDRMQEGYQCMMAGHPAQACDHWLPVWEVIRSRLRPEMRTCESASVVFDGTQVLYNWVQDFQLELGNAAVDDTRYAGAGVRLCEDLLTQFPDEDELFRLNFRADLGQFYYLAGRPEDGERVLEHLIRDVPDRALGYARLADILACGARRQDGPLDPRRAETLLEQALARPVRDAADFDLKARLDDLRNAVETAATDNPPQNP